MYNYELQKFNAFFNIYQRLLCILFPSQGSSSPRKEILHNIYTPVRSKTKIKVDKRRQYLVETALMGPREQELWGRADELSFNPTINAAIRYDKWKLITGLRGKDRPRNL